MNTETILSIGGVLGVGLTIATYIKIISPWIKKRVQRAIKRADVDRAMREVLLGRPAEAGNKITGEPGREKLPGIAERLNQVIESQNNQFKKLAEIQDELKLANDRRFKELEHTVKIMRHQINVLLKTLNVKAEAEKDLFPELIRNMNNHEPS